MTSLFHDFRFDQLQDWMQQNQLGDWAEMLPAQVDRGLSLKRFGDLKYWLDALARIPEIEDPKTSIGTEISITSEQITADQILQLREALQALIPWRKGPYNLCGIDINTEWRSNTKWDRLKEHISPLNDRLVLDVGCGNGYHMWRMLAQKPKRVIGVDPSPRFSIQFEMVKRLAGRTLPIDLIPISLEEIPLGLSAFHSVFSMGVIYHRRSPMEHIQKLKDCLLPGGELILESLVVAGDEHSALIPENRYAKMRNVWTIPSSLMILKWLKNAGFAQLRLVDESPTTLEEQRKTDWMRFESLADFLDPDDSTKTIEGYPAPRRAIVIATKPE